MNSVQQLRRNAARAATMQRQPNITDVVDDLNRAARNVLRNLPKYAKNGLRSVRPQHAAIAGFGNGLILGDALVDWLGRNYWKESQPDYRDPAWGGEPVDYVPPAPPPTLPAGVDPQTAGWIPAGWMPIGSLCTNFGISGFNSNRGSLGASCAVTHDPTMSGISTTPANAASGEGQYAVDTAGGLHWRMRMYEGKAPFVHGVLGDRIGFSRGRQDYRILQSVYNSNPTAYDPSFPTARPPIALPDHGFKNQMSPTAVLPTIFPDALAPLAPQPIPARMPWAVIPLVRPNVRVAPDQRIVRSYYPPRTIPIAPTLPPYAIPVEYPPVSVDVVQDAVRPSTVPRSHSHTQAPPAPDTVEIKARVMRQYAKAGTPTLKMLSTATEINDFIKAVYSALGSQHKARYGNTKWIKNYPTNEEMLQSLLDAGVGYNFQTGDFSYTARAAEALAKNEFEDAVYGALGQAAQRMARDVGLPVTTMRGQGERNYWLQRKQYYGRITARKERLDRQRQIRFSNRTTR